MEACGQSGESDHASHKVRGVQKDLRRMVRSTPFRNELQSRPHQAQNRFSRDQPGSGEHASIFDTGLLCVIETAAVGEPVANRAEDAAHENSEGGAKG